MSLFLLNLQRQHQQPQQQLLPLRQPQPRPPQPLHLKKVLHKVPNANEVSDFFVSFEKYAIIMNYTIFRQILTYIYIW